MSATACSNCAFWFKREDLFGRGECRLHGPAIMPETRSRPGDTFNREWPITRDLDWCGAFCTSEGVRFRTGDRREGFTPPPSSFTPRPCPECLSPAVATSRSSARGWDQYVECLGCRTRSPIYNTEALAILKWNEGSREAPAHSQGWDHGVQYAPLPPQTPP